MSPMHSEAASVQLDAIRALSVEERLRVAESLRAFAWELQEPVIAQRHPELTPAEARKKLKRAQARVRRLCDPGLDDVLDWCGRLAASQGYLRHDPHCQHHNPPRPGATRCTCGLERARGPPK